MVVAWGDNSSFQCDVPAPPAGSSYTQLATGQYRTVARLEPIFPQPTVYCTARVNSLGCTPSIAVVGLPSASFGNGCTLTTTHALGQQIGLYFHGKQGDLAAPLHGGFLCVMPPILRHVASSSGGSSTQCDGAFSQDLNAYISSGADPGLVAGASVWLQHWSRDPADPFGDSLSDALAATIGP